MDSEPPFLTGTRDTHPCLAETRGLKGRVASGRPASSKGGASLEPAKKKLPASSLVSSGERGASLSGVKTCPVCHSCIL